MTKLNLKYGTHVLIKNTGSELDGCEGRVIGVAVRHIKDIYIIQFLGCSTRIGKEGHQYDAFIMIESCLEPVRGDERDTDNALSGGKADVNG